MFLPPDIVGKGVMFYGCPSVYSSGQIYHDISWMAEQSWWNVQGIFTSPYW